MNIANKITGQFLWLLFILLPFSFVSGPFMPDLTFVIFAFYLLFNIKYLLLFLDKFKVLYLIIIFWIIITISSIFTNNWQVSFATSIVYIRFLLGGLGLGLFIIKNEKVLLYFGYSLIFCFIILIFDGYFQYIFEENVIGIPLREPDRLSSFFGEELKLGSYLSRLMPLFFFFIFKFKDKFFINIYLGLILLIALDILIFLSGERVAFAYLTLATIIMIILLKQYKLIRLITFIFSIILIIIISNSSEIIKNRMVDETIHQLGITNKVVVDNFNFEKENLSKNKIYAFTPHHHSHYLTSIEMFKLNPVIGLGTKSFRFECKNINPKSCSTHPHNTYMQLLAENGLLGFFPVIILLILISFVLLKDFYLFYFKNTKWLNDANLCLFICFFITLWPIIPTGSFYNNWLNTIYYLPLSIYVYVNFNNSNE